MEAEIFRNCSGFTDEQMAAVALVRGVTSAVCCTVLSVVLVALVILAKFYYQRICGTIVKRLTVGLIASDLLYQLSLALQLKYFYDPLDVKFCEANTFIDQSLGSVQLLFILGISLVLFIKILKVTTSWRLVNECYAKAEECTCTCFSWKINKLEIAFFASLFVLPLLIDWVPFVTNSYGPTGPWCWIHKLESNCSTHEAGLWEQIGLWVVPAGLVALLNFGLFTASLFLLCFAMKNTKLQKLIELGITDSILSLSFLALVFVLWPLEVILTAAINSATKQPLFGLWVAYGMATPVIITLVPLVLLLTIHLPLSLMIIHVCYKHPRRSNVLYGERDQATVHSSSVIDQPSHTTWNPSHEDLEKVPLTLEQQQPGYGNKC